MKCKEIRKAMRRGSNQSQAVTAEATGHIEICPACRDLLLLDRLAPAIIRAAGESNIEVHQATPSAALISKIRNRIQEMREQHSGSWELAIESMRGWLAAFAVTAVILIAVSIQWQSSVVITDFDHDSDELITQNPAEYLIGDIPDPGSSGKDNPHAHK